MSIICGCISFQFKIRLHEKTAELSDELTVEEKSDATRRWRRPDAYKRVSFCLVSRRLLQAPSRLPTAHCHCAALAGLRHQRQLMSDGVLDSIVSVVCMACLDVCAGISLDFASVRQYSRNNKRSVLERTADRRCVFRPHIHGTIMPFQPRPRLRRRRT